MRGITEARSYLEFVDILRQHGARPERRHARALAANCVQRADFKYG
jgi:hypothetical protein